MKNGGSFHSYVSLPEGKTMPLAPPLYSLGIVFLNTTYKNNVTGGWVMIVLPCLTYT